jgi:hypothetical protein
MKSSSVTAGVALCVLFSGFSSAALCQTVQPQTTSPQIVALGSPTAFSNAVISMISSDPITNPGGVSYCGSSIWSGGRVLASAVDGRSNQIPPEPGEIAVVWDNDATPTRICVYFSVDAVVGQRLFFGQSGNGNAVLSLRADAPTQPGANLVPFVKDLCSGSTTGCAGLPQTVFNSVNGAHFNVALTELRPEDAQFAYTRAGCYLDATAKTCLGYNNDSILSSFDQSRLAKITAFSATGTDPITGLPVPAFQTITIGAEPLVVFYNTWDTSIDGLGSLLPQNANTHVLAGIFAGLLGLNQHLEGWLPPGAQAKPIHLHQREPVSAAFNVFEWQVVRSRDGNTDLSQESGFGPTPAACFTPPAGTASDPATYLPPSVVCANPMNVNGDWNVGRTRAVGHDDMINAVNSSSIPNGLGYAFYSLGTFSGIPSLKYLTIDGVDPLYTNPSGGSFPNCSGFVNSTPGFSCSGAIPNFANVAGGNYRIWAVLRAITYASYQPPVTGPSVTGWLQTSQDIAQSTVHDFLPYQYCADSGCSTTTLALPVFRSHYNVSNVFANNGTAPGFVAANTPASAIGVESGGDMAGSVFNRQADLDYFALTGNEFLTWIE